LRSRSRLYGPFSQPTKFQLEINYRGALIDPGGTAAEIAAFLDVDFDRADGGKLRLVHFHMVAPAAPLR
jgi:hypothetical protein